jgi:O-antigen/teichoic acid export membrane protein
MKIGAFISSIKSLKDNKGFMRYFNNTSWLFLEKILKAINILIVGMFLARYLGPEQYGVLSYSLAYVLLFSALAKLGLDIIVVKALVKYKTERDNILGTSFILKLVGAILSILILLGISNTVHQIQEKELIFIFSFSIFFLAFSVIDFYFQSKVLSRFSVYASMFSLVVSILVKITLILYRASLSAFVYALLLEIIILSIAYLFFYFRNGFSLSNWRFKKAWAFTLLKDSFPLLLGSVFIVVYMKIDQIMIKSMLDAAEVGKYSVAVTLSEGWYFLPMIIVSSIFPAVINAKESNRDLYYDRLKNLYRLMFYLALIIVLPITFLSDWIIAIFYGIDYLDAAQILKIHIWAGIFVFLGVASTRWLIVENLQIFSTINTGLGALLNIILNYTLIPKYGIVGAAWATLISYFFSGFFVYIFFRKIRPNFILVVKSILFIK